MFNKQKQNKTIFITGSGSGLGKSAVIALGRRGHRIIASVHYETQIADMLEIKQKENIDIEVIKLDITKDGDRNKILEYDIDVLVCNAAIGDSGSIADINVERIEKVFNTNVFCNIKLAQLALKGMIKNKKGRLVFLSSMAGRIPFPFLAPYCSSKFAIEGFVTCLRNEMKILNKLTKSNIQVGMIEPGAYATGFNKENNDKKYKWMNKNSYFRDDVGYIRNIEEKVWNIMEVKPYNSIIKKYIRAVEDKKLKHRYYAPFYQAFFIQFLRILGM